MKKTVLIISGLVILSTIFLFGFHGKNNPSTKPQKSLYPNLIVIMTDDMGYSDVGFNGCRDIPTPSIDRIAENGVVFTNGYVTYSVCSPSRAGFITGRYPQQFGYERNVQYRVDDPDMGLAKEETTLADFLKHAGYKSGIIGKWHLGAHLSNHPLNRGFDEFFGHLGGGHRYFPEDLTIKDSYAAKDENESYRTWIMRNHDPVRTEEYLTDEFSNEAVKFIERHKDEPFFLYLAYNAPHTPLQAPEKYLSRFSEIQDSKRKTYAAMVSAVDDGVGKLLDKLSDLKIEDRTVVFFLSDNGGPEAVNGSDNGALRDGKGSVYEGGFRVPFAMQYKEKINPGIFDRPVSSMDIFATMAAITEIPVNPEKPLDGVNLIPFLNGENRGIPHENIFLRKFDDGRFAVRHGFHKLVTKDKGAVWELYNLQEDIGEENNILSAYPEIANQIDSLRAQWNKKLKDPAFLGLIHTEAWQRRLKNQENEK